MKSRTWIVVSVYAIVVIVAIIRQRLKVQERLAPDPADSELHDLRENQVESTA